MEPVAQQSELGQFFDTIYREFEGYAYVATKAAGNHHAFTQHFFQWPLQRDDLVSFVLAQQGTYEVYYAPALFENESAKKANVRGASVVWVEFDGKLPSLLTGIPEPTLRVASSIPGHNEHWYWLLDEFILPYDIEKINRALTYALGADVSGWDASQILRPIHTTNHKRGKSVHLVNFTGETHSPNVFSTLPEPPPPVEAPVPESLPPIEDVVARTTFPPHVWALFKQGKPEGERSEGLMALGYYLAELQLNNEEIFALLLNADERWGKFKGRQDRYKRLMEIVVRARLKYPLTAKVVAEGFNSIGLKTLLAMEVSLSWTWEGFLQEGGYFLLSGPSGVGKTQFSLSAAQAFVLGGEFLGRPVLGTHKIGVFSLEMGLVDLKYFLATQAKDYTPEQMEILEERFRLYPLGEPIYMNRDEEKKRIERAIEEEGFTGIIIDSLGSTTEDELTSEKDVKNLMDWNDHIRQKYGVFTWFIHHHRKATGDNKKPNKLSDVYGSQYITARATTVMCLWDTGTPNTLQAIPLKVRLSAKPPPLTIQRSNALQFTEKPGGAIFIEGTDNQVNFTKSPISDGPSVTADTVTPFG